MAIKIVKKFTTHNDGITMEWQHFITLALGQKFISVTNTLAYCAKSLVITVEKVLLRVPLKGPFNKWVSLPFFQ
jgi:hypothetical protein